MEKTVEKGVRAYEMSFLLRTEEDTQVIMKYLSDLGAEVSNEGALSRIKLAYPIKKENEAYFGFVHFTVEPKMITKLDEALEIEDKVLRFLIVTPPFVKQTKRRIYVPGQRREESERQEEQTATAPVDISNAALEEKLEEMSIDEGKTAVK